MSNPSDLPPFQISEERFAALSPEDKRRIGTAMRFLVDLKTLHIAGLQIASDMLEGKTPGAEVGMKLMDFERDLRLAANDMLKRPLRVVHADALRKGETKLDEEPWNMRVRIRASEARKVREEQARVDRLRGPAAPAARAAVEDEPEVVTAPSP